MDDGPKTKMDRHLLDPEHLDLAERSIEKAAERGIAAAFPDGVPPGHALRYDVSKSADDPSAWSAHNMDCGASDGRYVYVMDWGPAETLPWNAPDVASPLTFDGASDRFHAQYEPMQLGAGLQ
jgi:hypothetical protein